MIIYTDGATDRIAYQIDSNPAVIIKLPSKVTSNQAEYGAVVAALEALTRVTPFIHYEKEIILCADSQLIIRQITGRYSIKDPELRRLHSKVASILFDLGLDITFWWVPREENLAGIAIEQSKKEEKAK